MKLLKKIRDFLRPVAFEQRERDRQRREIVETLDSIQKMRGWCDGAEPIARDRLARLDREELELDTPSARGIYDAPKPAHSHKIEGEYLRVPRTARDVFGHDVTFEEPEIDRMRGARLALALALLGVAVGLWIDTWATF